MLEWPSNPGYVFIAEGRFHFCNNDQGSDGSCFSNVKILPVLSPIQCNEK